MNEDVAYARNTESECYLSDFANHKRRKKLTKSKKMLQ